MNHGVINSHLVCRIVEFFLHGDVDFFFLRQLELAKFTAHHNYSPHIGATGGRDTYKVYRNQRFEAAWMNAR